MGLQNLSRRKLLATAGVMGLGLATPKWAAATEREANRAPWAVPSDRGVLIIEQVGGNDGLNTIVPLADPGYVALRPTVAVDVRAAMPLGDGLGFNPALRELLPSWEAGDLAIALGISSRGGGSACHRARDAQAFAEEWAVSGLAQCEEGSPMIVSGAALHEPVGGPIGLETSAENTSALGRRQAFDRLRRDEFTGVAGRYPKTELGANLRTIARMIAAGYMPKLTIVHHLGYDTHSHQRKYHDGLLSDLAASIAAFRDELKELGRWGDLLLIVSSEFGRSPKENAVGGTEHGDVGPQLLLGGGVTGGMYGRQPAIGECVDGQMPIIASQAQLYGEVLGAWCTRDNLCRALSTRRSGFGSMIRSQTV